MEESQPTQFKTPVGWLPLWSTNELIWYSERSNFGQLYLIDLTSGAVKNQITHGDGPVTQIARLDATRTLWFAANGKEPDQDPYFSHFYRVNLDGTHQVSLTPDVGTHSVQLAADGRFPDRHVLAAGRTACGCLA